MVWYVWCFFWWCDTCDGKWWTKKLNDLIVLNKHVWTLYHDLRGMGIRLVTEKNKLRFDNNGNAAQRWIKNIYVLCTRLVMLWRILFIQGSNGLEKKSMLRQGNRCITHVQV